MTPEKTWRRAGMLAGALIALISILIATGEQGWAITINVRWLLVFGLWFAMFNLVAAVVSIAISGQTVFASSQFYGFLIIVSLLVVAKITTMANDFFLNTWSGISHPPMQ